MEKCNLFIFLYVRLPFVRAYCDYVRTNTLYIYNTHQIYECSLLLLFCEKQIDGDLSLSNAWLDALDPIVVVGNVCENIWKTTLSTGSTP